MASPLGLTVITDINNMQVGDCIPCRYTALTSGQAGYFSELGTCIANEIPIAGTATPDGLFYFIKTDKGTLIADRVIQHSISWDTLNAANYIEGLNTSIYNEASNKLVTSNGFAFSNETTSSMFVDGIYAGTKYAYCINYGACYAMVDLLSIRTINNVSVLLTTDVLTQWSGNANVYFSENGIDFILYGSVTNTIQPSKPVLVKKTYVGNVNARYIKVTDITKGLGSYIHATINEIEINKKMAIFRSLSGGVAFADANQNTSTTDKGLGTWPTNNEWDKYIAKSDLKGKIIKNDDNVWHWNNGNWSWCKDTPLNNVVNPYNTGQVATNSFRNVRGYANIINGSIASSSSLLGFRPLLNYIESDIASEVIY